MAADPTDPEAATFEADVIAYIWRVWRDNQAGTSPELEDVVVKTVALVAGEEGVSARVEWVSPRETGQPLHVTERRIARGIRERPRRHRRRRRLGRLGRGARNVLIAFCPERLLTLRMGCD